MIPSSVKQISPPSAAPERRAVILVRLYLGLGLLFIAAYFVIPRAAVAWWFAGLTFYGAIGAAFGLRLHRPTHPLPWRLLVAGLGLSTIGNACLAYSELSRQTAFLALPANILFVISYVVFGAALVGLARSRSETHELLMDGVIVATGISVVVWVFLIEPHLTLAGLPLSAKLGALAYPIMDIVILAAVFGIVFSPGARNPSYRLILSAVGFELVTDWLNAGVVLTDTYQLGGWPDAGWFLTYLFLGAAALHPSMRDLATVAHKAITGHSKARIKWFMVSSLIMLALAAFEAGRKGTDVGLYVALTGCGLMFVLILIRMHSLVKHVERGVAGLEEAKEKYRSIVETANEGIWIVDSDGMTTFTNQKMADLLGLGVAELIGSSLLGFVPTDCHHLVLQELSGNKGEGDGGHCEARLIRHDGTEFWVLISGSAMTDEAGAYMGSAALVTDMTERRRMDDELRQAQKMEAVGQLAGGIAHDFNNLLSVVINYAQFVKEDLEESDVRRADLDEIIRAGERGSVVTRQLLAFSRKEAAAPESANANDIFRGLEELVRHTIPENVELEMKLDDDLWPVVVDPHELEQVVLNLVLNARDAMPRGGTLRIETSNASSMDMDGANPPESGGYVRIRVTDSGMGMTESVRQRIFEPFFTTKEMGKGTGLGLATVYGMVTGAGGHISVRSTPGGGSTFDLLFPRSAQPASFRTAARHTSIQPKGRGELILVVEDEDGVRQLVTRLLRRSGYQVLSASGGTDALEIFRDCERGVDLLVTDVVMPGISGVEVAEKIGARTLFMSGYTQEMISEQGLAADQKLLAKPFVAEELLSAVAGMLGIQADSDAPESTQPPPLLTPTRRS